MRPTLIALAATALGAAAISRADVVIQSATRSVDATNATPYTTTALQSWLQTTSHITQYPGGGGINPVACQAVAEQASDIEPAIVDFYSHIHLATTDASVPVCEGTQGTSTLILNFTITRPTEYEFITAFAGFMSIAPPSAIRSFSAGGASIVRDFSNLQDRIGTLPAGSYELRIEKSLSWDASMGFDAISVYQETLIFTRRGLCCRGATCALEVAESDCVAISGISAGAAFHLDVTSCTPINTIPPPPPPCCHADYDKMNGVAVADIFAYLRDWFAGSPLCIVGGDGQAGAPTVQSIFEFLNVWFAGCP